MIVRLFVFSYSMEILLFFSYVIFFTVSPSTSLQFCSTVFLHNCVIAYCCWCCCCYYCWCLLSFIILWTLHTNKNNKVEKFFVLNWLFLLFSNIKQQRTIFFWKDFNVLVMWVESGKSKHNQQGWTQKKTRKYPQKKVSFQIFVLRLKVFQDN